MLGSILFLYVKSGSLEWANIAGASLSPNAQLAVFVGFFLAFAIKIPIFLFHSWQADTYSEASVPTALLLSAIFSKMGIYGLFRLVSLISPGIIPQVAPVIVGLCIVGAIYAALLAFSQSNLKRVIAYSSMSHLNLVAAAIFAAPHLAKAGAFFLAVSHVGLAIGFWWVIGVLKSRFGHVRLHELPGGIISENRVFTSVFFLLIMAGMAVPLTSGFPGEFVIIQGLLRFDFLTGMLACAPIIMGAVYMFRAYHTVMLGGNSPAVGTPIQLTKMEYGIAAFLILFILGLGIYPQIVFTLFGAV
jgi:NADH-quinone oxidoreductase subunit M